ncbi:MAG TPA: sigma-54 dependent transcriptional regulator [Bacteroidales bacterium]|nr:sigma-54 dependent transcriptional regulator [Bacteroidales bacterium]
MTTGRRILICDDDEAVRSSLGFLLSRNDYVPAYASQPESLIRHAGSDEFDLVLLDMNFSASTTGEEGLALLQQLKKVKPLLPVILITAWGSVELAVKGIKLGAADFIIKPWNNTQLLKILETSISLSLENVKSKRIVMTRDKDEFGSIIGNDPKLLEILEIVKKVAPTHAPVLITGESGTGKELIASAIHEYSTRKRKPFVKVNLGGIPSGLFESEMFGYRKGAFTDAKRDHEGRFEKANNGTIFLDEIGDLDQPSQVKLLRVLQDQTFERLGSTESITVDVRIVSATNHDLYSQVLKGTFREDLLYRINLIHVEIPPLRERKGDIPALAGYFTLSAADTYAVKPKDLSQSAVEWLGDQRWPGNVRELKNIIERTLLLSRGDKIMPDDFILAKKSGHIKTPSAYMAHSTLEDMERDMIIKTLDACGRNIARSAEKLGISRATLYRKMEKHGIQPDSDE